MRHSAKNGYLLHYLLSAAPYVNTLLGNNCFHLLHCITQTMLYALRALCGRSVRLRWEGGMKDKRHVFSYHLVVSAGWWYRQAKDLQFFFERKNL